MFRLLIDTLYGKIAVVRQSLLTPAFAFTDLTPPTSEFDARQMNCASRYGL